MTITNSCSDIAYGEGPLNFRLTLPADFPVEQLQQYRHSILLQLMLNWTTFLDVPTLGGDLVDRTRLINISNLLQNHWNGNTLIDLSVNRNAAVPSHVTNEVRMANMRYRVQAKLIFNGTMAAEWSPECESPIYQPCLSKCVVVKCWYDITNSFETARL